MKEIEKYMTPMEASFTWGIPRETLKAKYSPSSMNQQQAEDLQRMLDEGLIKYFLQSEGKRKEWIISRQAMYEWFGAPKK
ncbi:DNA-binding protein [Bacillus toyonensis]|uniref:DNA-binding protein n=1 Tax=Bacillus toyonensis TaxID=155322 RepID=UPI001C0C64A4|nr:DNA-binding protein [Bacillus toyonensis]MBU4642282.1 DNA-binding protein [Bacillus toyonensis]